MGLPIQSLGEQGCGFIAAARESLSLSRHTLLPVADRQDARKFCPGQLFSIYNQLLIVCLTLQDSATSCIKMKKIVCFLDSLQGGWMGIGKG